MRRTSTITRFIPTAATIIPLATASIPPPLSAWAKIVETFSHTNSNGVDRLNVERGWGGAWYGPQVGLFTNVSAVLRHRPTTWRPPATRRVCPPNNTGVMFVAIGTGIKSGRFVWLYHELRLKGPNGTRACHRHGATAKRRCSSAKSIIRTSSRHCNAQCNTDRPTLGERAQGLHYRGHYDWENGVAKVKAYAVGRRRCRRRSRGELGCHALQGSKRCWLGHTVWLSAGAGSTHAGSTYFDEARISTNWRDCADCAVEADPTNATATVDGMKWCAWHGRRTARAM